MTGRRLLLAGGLTLAALAAPAAAQEKASAYPTAAVLDAMRAACPTRAAAIAALAGGTVAGWTKVADPSSTPVGPLVAFGREAAAKMMGGDGRLLGDMPVHRRRVAGEDLYLVFSGVETGGVTVRGCRMFDPGETRALDVAAVTAWVKRPPADSVNRAELQKLSWEPGFAAGQDSFEIFRVPAGSPLRAMTKIDGLAMKADWVDTAPATDGSEGSGKAR